MAKKEETKEAMENKEIQIEKEKYYFFSTNEKRYFNNSIKIKGENITLHFDHQGNSSPIEGSNLNSKVFIVSKINRWQVSEWTGEIPAKGKDTVQINKKMESDLKQLETEYNKLVDTVKILNDENETLKRKITDMEGTTGQATSN